MKEQIKTSNFHNRPLGGEKIKVFSRPLQGRVNKTGQQAYSIVNVV